MHMLLLVLTQLVVLELTEGLEVRLELKVELVLRGLPEEGPDSVAILIVGLNDTIDIERA